MTDSAAAQFRRVAILGTGLIGGSFALALRRRIPGVHITGFDVASVLEAARTRGLVDEASPDLAGVMDGADLVYIALPISVTIELLPLIARHAAPNALVTDSGSTKRAICLAAAQVFTGGAIFLGGHPMAGKEMKGMDAATVDLFHGAKYALIGDVFTGDALTNDALTGDNQSLKDLRVMAFAALLESIGASPVWLDAGTHDWAVAIISHLPQMAAIALAEVIGVETDESGLPASLAGGGARDALRLAGSPYAMWRDVAFTNSDNLSRALDSLSQAIDHLRTHLTSREMEKSFAEANRVYKLLLP